MNICDINPYIRFADTVNFCSKGGSVYGKDCRFFFIQSGTAEIKVKNDKFTLTQNSLFYCNSYIPYDISSEGCEILALNFDLTQSNNKTTGASMPYRYNDNEENLIHPSIVDDSPFLSRYMFLKEGSVFKSALFDIKEEFSQRKLYYKERASGILKMIITDIHRNYGRRKSSATSAIEKILAYISNNYAMPIENKELARLVGYHEYHLNRLFLKSTGMSIRKYIINLRIDEAKRLLINTDLQISDIAEQVGFSNNTYFSSYFKKITDYTPMTYRKSFKFII